MTRQHHTATLTKTTNMFPPLSTLPKPDTQTGDSGSFLSQAYGADGVKPPKSF